MKTITRRAFLKLFKDERPQRGPEGGIAEELVLRSVQISCQAPRMAEEGLPFTPQVLASK